MKLIAILPLIPVLTGLLACAPDNKPGRHADPEMVSFIAELMEEMTLEEKIGQINLVSVGFDVTGPRVSEDVEEKIVKGQVGAVFNTYTPVAVRKLQELAVTKSRLGIPLLFGFDVVHGHRTIFPVPLGLSSCWDMDLIEKSARIAAEEASAEGLTWTFSPMVDVSRDPRWGRVCEGSGEDAWYGSLVAEAMVRGYQGEDLAARNTVLACIKHFALYGGAMAGRDYSTVDMSMLKMTEDFLPPYRAAVEAGAGSVMTSFNDINGVPATANRWLLTELLREQWGFEGFVVTDYTAVEELIPFGVAKDERDAARLSLEAGVDMDMVSEIMVDHIGALIEEQVVDPKLVDEACRRILEAKYRLGLFDDPYRYADEQRGREIPLSREYRNAAMEIATKSMVLLKNENETLPLKKEGSIALIGPLASSQRDVIGNWSGGGRAADAVSVEEGLRKLLEKDVVIHAAKGANISDDTLLLYKLNAHGGRLDYHDPAQLLKEALRAARKADVILAVVGESQGMSGESASRSQIGIPKSQLDLLKALKKTGKPLVIVLMNGRPLALEWENQHADAILETWFAGTEAGNAIARILYGESNPSGKLTATFPRNIGQIPIFYNHKNIGRPYGGDILDKFKSQYLDVSNEPLFPFGFGLSYTTFSYGALRLSSTELGNSGSLNISLEVSNTGSYAGEEVVQLYVQDLVASVTRPVKELKAYQKISLSPGEARELTFTLSPDDLRFYNTHLEYINEPGAFKVYVGTNSRDVQEAGFQFVR